MGTNIPRPTKRPRTPPIYEPPKMPMTAPCKRSEPIEELNYRVKRTTNCPNCNAALSFDVCEYCGTRVGWDEGTVRGAFNSEPVVIPINIRGEQIDEIMTSLRAFNQFGSTAHDFGISLPTNEQR